MWRHCGVELVCMRSVVRFIEALLLASCGFVSCMTPQVVQPDLPEVWELNGDLEPLRTVFNAHQDSPRVVALIPISCPDALQALRAAKREAEELDKSITWLIIWQDELLGDDCQQAKCASGAVDPSQTIFFHDCELLAGRGLAGGTILSGQLRRAYLFYPAGTEWGEQAPEPSTWVHRMGRLIPDRSGDAQRLTADLRDRWSTLAQPR